MFRITETVKHLILINVVFFFLVEGLRSASFSVPEMALVYPPSSDFSPYQLITHMFIHADLNHLFFNMLILFFIGPMVDDAIGSKKFTFVYLSAGIVGTIIEIGFTYLVDALNLANMSFFLDAYHLGASGAIFGIVAAFGILFPEREIMLMIPPIPLKGKYLALLLLGMGLFTGYGKNIGHMAHLIGALVGGGIVYYWLKKREI